MVDIDNILNEENEEKSNSNDGVEPEVKQTIEKKKKPRSPAQIAAFEKAIAKRKANVEEKKKNKKVEIKEEPVIKTEMVKPIIEEKNSDAFPSTQTGFNPLDVDLKAWMEMDNTPEPEEVEEDDEDYEEEESEESEEEEIIVKKKPKTKTVKSKPIPIPKKKPIEKKKKQKIVYVSDSEDDEPEPDPIQSMSWRDRSRLRGF